ncbi:hypothetical protein BGX28_000598 [Mortierella sp. GBA30]|nr:hypothetical protein BGX28_000598 [Mortierella sp. GBA30]
MKLNNDPRYKKYVQLVERNLQSFDNVNEWADVNPFLLKIMRSFQAYPQYTVIPKSLTVAKRLAQCLNPALPAGVHGKTLDVYAYILETIGPDQLAEDITLWSYGLFPFLQYASLSVKPQLLDIYEKYYLPLKDRLKPCLKSFMIGLLPGLDEEGSEFFDRVLNIMDSLRKAVDETFFFQCMWLILITSSPHRGPALHYLSRRMPLLTNTEGDDAGLMVRAFSATVGDSQLLVQRAMLDLMVVHFPISNGLIEDDDLTVLVKAAVGVVLRKDMSLNRRLYAWLLGAQEGKKKVFDGPAKKALIAGLQSILLSDGEVLQESQKPYRVFVSLLDEWDIGYPVIQAVFLDALRSLKRRVDSGNHGAELIQTASMWIDMTDPYLIWKKLSEAVYDNFPAKSSQEAYALDLVIFFLGSFKLNDEEMQHMHVPMFLLFLLTRIDDIVSQDKVLQYADQVNNALSLCLMLFRHIPASVFAPQTNQMAQGSQPTRAPKSKPSTPTPSAAQNKAIKIVSFEAGMSAKEYIEEFYMLQPQKADELQDASAREYAGISGMVLTQQALAFVQTFIGKVLQACMAESRTHTPTLRTMVQRSCKILSILSKNQSPPVTLQDYFSGLWLEQMRTASSKVEDFATIDALLTTLVELTVDLKVVQPSFLDNRDHMKPIVDRLWTFLAEECMQLHLRASQLIWMLQDVTSLSHEVETTIASYLVSDSAKTRIDAFQKFGVFWRLSDDIQHNSAAFVRPMMLMLDSLSSTNPSNRRAGETWIRSNLKSYPRLLDPLLLVLYDQSIVRNQAEETFHNEYFPVHYYVRNFNQAQVQYVFNTLLTVFRFGGLGFLRSIRQSTVPIDTIPTVADIVGVTGTDTAVNYEIPVSNQRFIESEPASEFKCMLSLNEEIHMVAADFLHFIISKIDHIDTNLLALIHKTVINKMLYCINHGQLDLQSRLLHLLHATILMGTIPVKKASSTGPGSQHGTSLPRDSSLSTFEGTAGSNQSNGDTHESLFRIVGSSPLFVKTVFDALSVPTNRPILQHWMDFLMLALPFLTNYFRKVLLPVIQCLCDQILRSRAFLLEAYTTPKGSPSGSPSLTDHDLMIFLTGLERLLTFSLAEARLGEEVDSVHKQEWNDGQRGTQGLVANVLSIEVHPSDSFQENKARDTVLYNIVGIIHILIELWSVFDNKNMATASETETVSLQFVGERVRARVKRILAGLYKSYPSEVTEAFVELFLTENPTALDLDSQKSDAEYRTLDILSVVPGASPLAIFLTLIESIRTRTQGAASTRSKRPNLRISKATDIVLLRFLEIYCTYLPSVDSLVDLWPLCLNFVREYFPQATSYKYAFPSLLRVMTVLCDRLSQTTYFDDKKIRRDAAELYQRVLDYCVLIAGRSFDQGIWLRNRNPQDFEVLEESDDSRESTRPPSSNTTEAEQARRAGKTKEDVLIQQILVTLCQMVIPNLRRILQEQDRVTTAITNLMYYVIAPSLKSRVGINDSSVDLLREISRIPFAYRTWRKEVWEVFLDNRFFAMGPVVARKWRVLIQTAMTAEKDRLVELLGRISTSPTSALFTSRDQESLNRALMLRRLTFVIWCGTVDQYLPQLPNIQEKLVELLKLSSTEQVHPEIYLCLRVMLCRISNQHLNNFWPVLLTELIQLFNLFLTDENDRPEQVNLFLSACKFLDLLFVLEDGTYFIHQWIFISDAIRKTVMHSPMGEALPHALMDRLGKKLFEEAPLEGYPSSTSTNTNTNTNTLVGSMTSGTDVSYSSNSAIEQQRLQQQSTMAVEDRWLTENDILEQMSFGSTMSSFLTSPSGATAVGQGQAAEDRRMSTLDTSLQHQHPQQQQQLQHQHQQQHVLRTSSRVLKRPMLTMRSIQHVRELEFFLTHVAQYVYHTTYVLAKPDTQFIEDLIERDMLGGSSIDD